MVEYTENDYEHVHAVFFHNRARSTAYQVVQTDSAIRPLGCDHIDHNNIGHHAQQDGIGHNRKSISATTENPYRPQNITAITATKHGK